MRPIQKPRRTVAKHHYDCAPIDQVTGEVLDPDEPHYPDDACPACGCLTDPMDFFGPDHGEDMCGWGRSHNGVLRGAMWDSDEEVGCWPVAADGTVLYSPTNANSGPKLCPLAARRAAR